MSRHTSNVIPFPNNLPHEAPPTPKPSSRMKRLAKLQEATSCGATSMSQAIPQAMAMCAAKPDASPDPAIVAQVVIGFARRKGIAMTSVPKIFREQLLTLCAVSDPTALMLRDWLEGNRKLLGVIGMPTPHGIHGTEEGA
ncbi:hypothetical protein M0412_08790 [Agrobacterium sp. O3.4]|uniref:Uncharacterized protein n=2 Tax=Rhizobium/Agrobacterium group TaxID=227290 RepID=A0A546XNG3_RHIRH|nr:MULTISPECIES: hypothetical protein [Rhizobium/Agrobacterium group]MCZ7468155.1 hypothetical protein [Rhizobium rhizogenes]TRB02291.1 hypothetical protein EXN68_00885 [Rhizobium rhizogenes]WHO08699.1 hypothetical protein KZ699_02570 [Agrobacterium cucumeris]